MKRDATPAAALSRVAYLVNQYPKVSHSFVRREIQALERQGMRVQRIALQGWRGELADDADRREREQTRYVLRAGLPGLVWAAMRMLLTAPHRFFPALRLALRMGRDSERSLPYHLAYLAEACRVVRWTKDFGAAHLHAHFGTNSAEVAMLAHVLGGPPFSFTVHGSEVFSSPRFLGLAEKVRRSAFVVAASSYVRAQLFRWCDHRDWPKVNLVHCGLEPGFHRAAACAPARTPRIVCVGRLSEEKGHLLLLESAVRLAEKGIAYELVLAGDGEMRPLLERVIAERGLDARVRVTGWISEQRVREEILASRALVSASFAEGLPVVLMEAMALRRPVLATFVGGVPELVLPGKTGWLFPAGSVDALTAALEDCLCKPLDELREMGEAAQRRVLERHSVDVEAAKLAQLFNACAEVPA